MKMRILWADGRANYKPNDVTDAPKDVAEGLIASGAAEKLAKGDLSEITYVWPEPELNLNLSEDGVVDDKSAISAPVVGSV